MAYVNTPDGDVWVNERDVEWNQDPLRLAGETLAKHAETYLYDTNSPHWMKPEYLAWAIADYDIRKTGTGNYAQTQSYDQFEAQVQPFEGTPAGPNQKMDVAVRFPEHARKAEHINTDPPADVPVTKPAKTKQPQRGVKTTEVDN